MRKCMVSKDRLILVMHRVLARYNKDQEMMRDESIILENVQLKANKCPI